LGEEARAALIGIRKLGKREAGERLDLIRPQRQGRSGRCVLESAEPTTYHQPP
jgi:hypothetical protein